MNQKQIPHQTPETRRAVIEAIGGAAAAEIARSFSRRLDWAVKRVEMASRFETPEAYIAACGAIPGADAACAKPARLQNQSPEIRAAVEWAIETGADAAAIRQKFAMTPKQANLRLRMANRFESVAEYRHACETNGKRRIDAKDPVLAAISFVRHHPEATPAEVMARYSLDRNQWNQVRRRTIEAKGSKQSEPVPEPPKQIKPTIIGRTRTKLLCNNGGNWELPENVKKWSEGYSFSVEVV
jgi:hypothetical protein